MMLSKASSVKAKLLGFSLVELMIAVAVLAIIMSIAFPSFNAMIKNSQIRSAAESIQNGIQLARAEAVKRNAPVQFDLRGTNSAWTICTQPASGGCPSPDDATTIQSRDESEGSSSSITVVTTDAAPFIFNSLGAMTSPVPASNGLVAVTLGISTTALPAAQARNLRVLISAGGNIRMCDLGLARNPVSTPNLNPRACPTNPA
jgi:type IV fimbrial biogenesis protein FimT